MKPEDLTAEQKETKLSDEQLEAASGGTGGSGPTNYQFTCPKCGSTNVDFFDAGGYIECTCKDCWYKWGIPY